MGASLRDVHIDLELLEADRQRHALKIVDIVGKTELSQSTVSDIFNGRRKTLSALKKIAESMGYEVQRYLLAARKRKGPKA